MRTTLTLDTDVVSMIETVEKRSNDSRKEVVNQALRRGLLAMLQPEVQTRKAFRTRAKSLGRCALPNLDDVASVLAAIEGENFK